MTEIIGRHGCESELNHVGSDVYACADHRDDCVNIDLSSLEQGPNVTITKMEICFCSNEL